MYTHTHTVYVCNIHVYNSRDGDNNTCKLSYAASGYVNTFSGKCDICIFSLPFKEWILPLKYSLHNLLVSICPRPFQMYVIYLINIDSCCTIEIALM